jgi:hypothetical protein
MDQDGRRSLSGTSASTLCLGLPAPSDGSSAAQLPHEADRVRPSVLNPETPGRHGGQSGRPSRGPAACAGSLGRCPRFHEPCLRSPLLLRSAWCSPRQPLLSQSRQSRSWFAPARPLIRSWATWSDLAGSVSGLPSGPIPPRASSHRPTVQSPGRSGRAGSLAFRQWPLRTDLPGRPIRPP